MDLGISDLERPSTDYVKHGFMVHVDRSNYEGVGVMFEFTFILVAATMVCLWLVIGGEGDE